MKRYPYNVEVGDLIKGVGEVVWILNRNKHLTILKVMEYETGKIKILPFDNEKEVEIV